MGRKRSANATTTEAKIKSRQGGVGGAYLMFSWLSCEDVDDLDYLPGECDLRGKVDNVWWCFMFACRSF